MKCLLKFTIAACLLSYSLCLPAQAALDGNSKWTVGIETGIIGSQSCRSCTFDNLNTSRTPIALRGEHRLFRWLSVQMEVGLHNIHTSSSRIPESTLTIHNIYPLFLKSQLTSITATIGPRLQLRIGQGDLGLEFRDGIIGETLTQQLRLAPDSRADLSYNWSTGRVNAWRLSYTYWPTARLAVAVGLELLQARNMRPLQAQFDPEMTIPIDAVRESLVLEDGTYNARQNFHRFQTLTLGVHYRL